MLGYVALAMIMSIALYLFALMIAVTVGGFFAVLDYGQERSNIVLAMIAGAAIPAVSIWMGLPNRPSLLLLTGAYHWKLFAASVGATVACWLIARSVNDSW